MKCQKVIFCIISEIGELVGTQPVSWCKTYWCNGYHEIEICVLYRNIHTQEYLDILVSCSILEYFVILIREWGMSGYYLIFDFDIFDLDILISWYWYLNQGMSGYNGPIGFPHPVISGSSGRHTYAHFHSSTNFFIVVFLHCVISSHQKASHIKADHCFLFLCCQL